MEVITVGESLLPSGLPIQRLALLSRPGEVQPFQLLVADDGATIYARQYPHVAQDRADEWDAVGPREQTVPQNWAILGFHRQELETFVKDA